MRHTKWAFALCATSLIAIAALPGSAAGGRTHDFGPATLLRFAQLPAATFLSASEPSGALLGSAPVNGVSLPFDDQTVQGFSGILKNSDGSFDVLSDNGYGSKANSSDFVLRIQRIAPTFGAGTIDVVGGINLTDPFGKVPFPLTRADRVLTGADFDPESIVRVADGSYWIGDEFGPYLLHFDRAGRLLAAPVALPGVFAPENPQRGSTPPNLNSSKGFESLALSPDGRTLNALLEGPVAGDPTDSLRLNEFSLASGAYTGRTWIYQLDSPAFSATDAATVDANRLLVVERDSGQGAAAVVKKVYLADKRDRDHDGKLDKTLVADLLNIANPNGVGGFGPVFRFPFITIEDVIIFDDRTIGVLNDNNFPFSAGRTPGVPDNDEFIILRLDGKLGVDKRVLH